MSTDEKLKTFDVAVEEPKKKPPYKEGAIWLSESLDLNHLYRVKGRQGLFSPMTRQTKKGRVFNEPNKAGMINMQRFMSDERLWTKRTELEALGGAVIYKNTYTDKVQDTIPLEEAFDNLQEIYDGKTIDVDNFMKGIIGAPETLNIICPNHDPMKFRDYHAKKIIGWYNIIIHSINKAEE